MILTACIRKQLIETLCPCHQSMRITPNQFVNSTDFLNITTTVKPNHHEEETYYNWLFGVGIFLFFLCIGFSRGNGKAAPNRRPQATPPSKQTNPAHPNASSDCIYRNDTSRGGIILTNTSRRGIYLITWAFSCIQPGNGGRVYLPE